MEEPTKTCRKCGERKPLSAYDRHPQQRDGRHPRCKDCRRVEKRAHYLANRAKHLAQGAAWKKRNREHYLALQRAWYQRQMQERPEEMRRQARATMLRNNYGLTPEGWDALFAKQNNVCAICGTTDPQARYWQTDHDRKCCPGDKSCGKCVRGILCGHCNKGIGHFRDQPELLLLAHAYVAYHG